MFKVFKKLCRYVAAFNTHKPLVKVIKIHTNSSGLDSIKGLRCEIKGLPVKQQSSTMVLALYKSRQYTSISLRRHST